MTKKDAIDKFLAQAREDIGVTEHPRGSNRGSRVDQMMAYTGLRGAYPWCAGAVTAWGVEALGEAWPVPPTADCDRILAWAREHNCLYSTRQKGDIFLRLASTYDANHTGACVNDDENTIEGNTNDGGSRDGYGVFARQRSDYRLKFVRWTEALGKNWTGVHDKPVVGTLVSPFNLTINGNNFAKIKTRVDDKGNARLWVPARPFVAIAEGTSLEAAPIGWDANDKEVIVAGREFTPWFPDNRGAWVPLRETCEALNLVLVTEGKNVTVKKSAFADPAKDAALRQGVE